MADKDDDASSISRSMSSGLSDSWSLVNTDGDIADDDSCSTTSSVEVVDDDEADVDQQSQLTSLSTSPSMATPKGPMFVLRLSSHDVSDTDDDQPSNVMTEGVTNSESFDVLTGQKQAKKNTNISPSQSIESSPELEEHVENFLKAISEVKTNYESEATGSGSFVELDQNSLSKNPDEGDKQESSKMVTLPECQKVSVEDSSCSEKLVESVGIKTWADTVDDADLTTSDFSFLNNERDVSANKDSPDTSDSTIMNQSMERTESAGDQQLTDNVNTEEPPDEHETDNQSHGGNVNFVERLVQWYNLVNDMFITWRQGLSRDSIIVYMCVVMAIMFLASTYTAYTVLLKKDKATKHFEQYQFLQDNFNYVQGELEKCKQTKEQLKFDIVNMDKTCEVPLQKVVEFLRRWIYTSPKGRQSMVDVLSTEAQNYCGVEATNCNVGQDAIANKIGEIAHLLKLNLEENLKLERNLLTSNLQLSKLKASLEETRLKLAEAEMAIESQTLDNSKMDDTEKTQETEEKKETTEKSTKCNEHKNGCEDDLKRRKSNFVSDSFDTDNMEGAQDTESSFKHFSNDKEDVSDEEIRSGSNKDSSDEQEAKTDDEVLFNQCLNVMLEYYKQKLNEKPKFDWFDYGSGVMREYLFGYLHDIIPENMQAFMQRLHKREASLDKDNQYPSTEKSDDDKLNGESIFDKKWEEDKGYYKRFGERTEEKNGDYDGADDDGASDGEQKDNYGDDDDEGVSDSGQKDGYDDDDDERQNTGSDDSDFTNSSAGRWTDSILDMMNKTRTQLQETWDQVKNTSEKIWIKHEPAITRLQDTFKRKLQNLSTKFQEKLVKKARKWFNKSMKGSRKDKEADQKDENFANTKRRKENTGSPKEEINPGLCKQFVQMRDLLARRMSAQKFRRSELSPNLISRMKKLKREDDLPKSSAIRNWLDCQLDWWANNENFPTEMPQYVVTDKCFDWLECWQIEISEGDHGIGRRKCERLKKGNNIQKSLTECEEIRSKMEDENSLHKHYDHPDIDADDDDDTVDYNDDYEEDPSDEEIENWFLRRAEMRDYHHNEPDDWYFRRYNKWQQETTGKKNNFDL